MSSVSEKYTKYRSYFFIALAVLLVPAIAALRVEADVAIFLSDSYEEVVVEESPVADDTLIRHQHRWSAFQGSVPEMVAIERIELALSWSVGESLIEEVVNDLAPSPATAIDGLESHEVESTVDVLPTPEAGNEVSDAPDSLQPSDDAPPQVVEEDMEMVTEEVIAVPEILSPAQDLESVPSEPSEMPGDEDRGEELPVVSKEHLFPWAQEGVVEEVYPEVVEEEVSVSLVEEVATETTLEPTPIYDNGEIDEPLPSVIDNPVDVLEEEVSSDRLVPPTYESDSASLPTESLIVTSLLTAEEGSTQLASSTLPVVRYSLDGLFWITLGVLDLSHDGNAVFDLSQVTLEELPGLQIVLEYRAENDASPVTFDDVQLNVTYGEPIIEEVVVPPPPSDQEPNFLISAVKTDVSSGNIRAVVIEKGGIFEFWFALTDRESGVVTWQRLAGSGAVDGTTPVAIEKRTIFWIDRTQQTLFGYTVDTASLFGTPISDTGEGFSTLQFSDRQGEVWQVIFGVVENSFTFERVDSP